MPLLVAVGLQSIVELVKPRAVQKDVLSGHFKRRFGRRRREHHGVR